MESMSVHNVENNVSNSPFIRIALDNISSRLVDSLESHDNVHAKVIKRNKKLRNGDFMVIIRPNDNVNDNVNNVNDNVNVRVVGNENVDDVNGCIRLGKIYSGIPAEHTVGVLSAKVATLFDDHSKNETNYCANCEMPRFLANVNEDGTVRLMLDRTTVYRSVVTEVHEDGAHYGNHYYKTNNAGMVMINITDAQNVMASHEGDDLTVSQLRTLLLSQHIARLMNSNGIKTSCTIGMCSRLAQKYGLDLLNPEVEMRSDLEKTIVSRLSRATVNNSYRCDTEDDHCEQTSEGLPSTQEMYQRVFLDLQTFIKDNNHLIDGKCYDPNLHIANFSSNSENFKEVCQLEAHFTCSCATEPNWCIHVVSRQQKYHQQQVDIGWKMTSDVGKKIKQYHFVHGGVQANTSYMSADLYLEATKKQIEQVTVEKYGATVDGSKWDSTVTSLSLAAIKFQLLQATAKLPVKLPGDGEGHPGRGTFVLYNCARLNTLLTQFYTAVQHGTYPPLPGLADVDFSTLKDEEEWSLMFNYVMYYPAVIKDSVSGIVNPSSQPQVLTHKICQFLYDLSRDFSSYYSRVRILVEARDNLLPTMFARIHLLKALQQVIHNALHTLNIEPLNHL